MSNILGKRPERTTFVKACVRKIHKVKHNLLKPARLRTKMCEESARQFDGNAMWGCGTRRVVAVGSHGKVITTAEWYRVENATAVESYGEGIARVKSGNCFTIQCPTRRKEGYRNPYAAAETHLQPTILIQTISLVIYIKWGVEFEQVAVDLIAEFGWQIEYRKLVQVFALRVAPRERRKELRAAGG